MPQTGTIGWKTHRDHFQIGADCLLRLPCRRSCRAVHEGRETAELRRVSQLGQMEALAIRPREAIRLFFERRSREGSLPRLPHGRTKYRRPTRHFLQTNAAALRGLPRLITDSRAGKQDSCRVKSLDINHIDSTRKAHC